MTDREQPMPNPFAQMPPLSKLMLCVKCWSIMLSQWGIAETIPAGDHPVAATIAKPFVRGGTIEGAGDGQYVKLTSSLRGEMTALLPAPGVSPVLQLTGERFEVSRITFANLLAPNTGIGLLITSRYPDDPGDRPVGLGSGKHKLDRLTFQGFKCGLQFGETLDTVNSDSTNATQLWFFQCETCVNIVNTMGMTCTFDDVTANGCADVFRFEAGGKWTMKNIFCGYSDSAMPDGAVLHLVGTGRLNNKGQRIEQGIGNNNNNFLIENVNMDTTAGSAKALVRLDHHFTHPPKVVINGGMIAYDHYHRDGKHQIITRNPCSVTIVNFVGLQGGTFANEHQPGKSHTRYLIENCVIDTTDINGDGKITGKDLLDPQRCDASKVWLTVRDCQLPDGTPIKPNVYLRPMEVGL